MRATSCITVREPASHLQIKLFQTVITAALLMAIKEQVYEGAKAILLQPTPAIAGSARPSSSPRSAAAVSVALSPSGVIVTSAAKLPLVGTGAVGHLSSALVAR